ncbi:MAG: hypothetical protein JKY37_07720, partial [Nannocystaceae bacterium]|nr:hypothetical protein [Nannocystaceae bacterium]
MTKPRYHGGMPIGGILFDLPAVAGRLALTLTTLVLLSGCPSADDDSGDNSGDSDTTSDGATEGSTSSDDATTNTAANTETTAAMTHDAESSTGLPSTTVAS